MKRGKMAMYYIGIDGGGSYSRMIAIDEDMKVIGRHAGNAVSFDRFNYDGVKNNMTKLLNEFNRLTNTRMSECKALCIGGADLNQPKYADWVEKALQEMDVACPIRVTNAKALLIAAETKGKPGIGLMTGISVMSCAIDSMGDYYQAGDYGFIPGDGGSSYKIGLDAVRAALLCSDGVIADTMLLDKVREHFKLADIREIIPYMNSDALEIQKIAELSLVVKYAAQKGDEAAAAIETNAATELFLLTRAMIERLQFHDATIVLCGSVILANESIQSKYVQFLHKDYSHTKIATLREKSETGAAYLAMQL